MSYIITTSIVTKIWNKQRSKGIQILKKGNFIHLPLVNTLINFAFVRRET